MAEEMIRIEGLKKVYGSVTALRDINLSVAKGDIHGIIGMSGAGKSTLIRCINLLDRPTGGKIWIDGTDVTVLNDRDLRNMRRTVGMIFQQFNLLMQRNVIKNVCFPMEIAGVPKAEAMKRAEELLDIVSLGDKKYAYPAQLSGGQRQRVAIARALATNPKVLMCDEATSALDPMTTQSILRLVQDINKRLGITVLVITHEMEVIRQICNNVSIIDEGVIAESGAVSEIFSNPRSETGKRLFRGVLKSELSAATGRLIRVVFDGSNAYEPVLSRMILECGAPVSVLSAQLETVSGESKGQMVLRLPEDGATAEKAMRVLLEKGVRVEEVDG